MNSELLKVAAELNAMAPWLYAVVYLSLVIMAFGIMATFRRRG